MFAVAVKPVVFDVDFDAVFGKIVAVFGNKFGVSLSATFSEQHVSVNTFEILP